MKMIIEEAVFLSEMSVFTMTAAGESQCQECLDFAWDWS